MALSPLPAGNKKRDSDTPMVKVQVRPNEHLDKALRRLKKICSNEGIIRELKRRKSFEKPSQRRRRKERERLKAIRLGARK